MDMGELDAAEVEILLSEHADPTRNRMALLARARLLALEGNEDAAAALLDAHQRTNRISPLYWYQLAELQTQRDELYIAHNITNLIRFRRLETPSKIVLRAHLQAQSGDLEGAHATAESALAALPHHPLYLQLADELGITP